MKYGALILVFCSLCLVFFNESSVLASEEGYTPSGILISQLEEFVDDYVSEYIGETVSGAAIAVVKNNQLVLSKGYGYANIEQQMSMDAESTVLEWGSISKLLVWTAAMQLVEQKKLDLNEDIKLYLPEGYLSDLKYNDPITMLNLMHHNAGFEEYIFDLGYATSDQVLPLDEGLDLAKPKQVYRPGEVVAYSNYSTSLAAYIIERITGEPFDSYVNKHIFSTLLMNQTVADPAAEGSLQVIQSKATGYELASPQQFIASTPYYMSMYPSGAVNGTVVDLAKFANALMPSEGEQSLLFETNDTLTEMLSTSYRVHEAMPGIAHGFWEYDGKSKGFTHAGNTHSFSSNFHIVPEENFAVVILTNQAGESSITHGLTEKLVGTKKIEANVIEQLPDSSELEGTYISARRTHHGFINLYSFLTPYSIQSLKENEIQLTVAGLQATFQQVEPYVYQMIDGHDAFILTNRMYFDVQDGEVTKISMAISDYLPLPAGKTLPLLVAQAVIFIVGVLYFVVSLVTIFIIKLIRRKKSIRYTPTSKWHTLLHVAATMLVINIAVLIIRMLSNSDRAYAEVQVHIFANYGITALGFFCLYMLIRSWKKVHLSKQQKVYYVVTIVFWALLIALLVFWNFYYL